MRTIIDYQPFLDLTKFWGDRGRWPARWIAHPEANGGGPVVQACRCSFAMDRPRTVRLHVSADERYELYLDGRRIGRGPERGDRLNWRFETYDLDLAGGSHMLVARSWWLGGFGPAPFAQLTVRPGFVLAAEGEDPRWLNIGFAAWETKLLAGYRHVPPGITWGTGSKVHVVGRDYAWDAERGLGNGWTEPQAGAWALGPIPFSDQPLDPILTPATLPAMIERTIHVGRARHVQTLSEVPTGEVPVRAADHLEAEAVAWNALLAGRQPIIIPPRTVRRVIVDLQNYYCAYTDLVTTGGRGASVHGFWNEERGLFADDLKRTRFSEHTQCLALLGDAVDAGRRPQVIERLFSDEWLARTTVYFSHYLFETCALTGRMEPFFERLKLWFGLKGQGFKTTLEAPEPSRSDCHAWGAHPMFHYYATILGVRPASPGFATVAIRPRLGPLPWARGTMVHPKGLIEVNVEQADGKIRGRVKLPPGVGGSLRANDQVYVFDQPTLNF